MSNITKILIENTTAIECGVFAVANNLISLRKDFTKREMNLNQHPLIWVRA
ncbi:MAG: hypothetical protein WCX74_03385 [Candidatus Paceibacterota bacterium]